MQNGIEKKIKDGKAARTAGFVCLGLCAVAMILVIICGSDVRAYQGLVARLERNPGVGGTIGFACVTWQGGFARWWSQSFSPFRRRLFCSF